MYQIRIVTTGDTTTIEQASPPYCDFGGRWLIVKDFETTAERTGQTIFAAPIDKVDNVEILRLNNHDNVPKPSLADPAEA